MSEDKPSDMGKDSHDTSTPGGTERDGQPIPVAAAVQLVPASVRPPNGGLEAWLFVLAGFFIFANSW